MAVKTGTSKGYRDNWTVGYTREVTVAVWVGNFDGAPMVRSSGVTGAGPLFHDVMLAAMRGRVPGPLVDLDGLVSVEVCALSGERPGPACDHREQELFVAGTEPHERCSLHERVWVDSRDGGRSAPGCPDAEERTFERYPSEYAAWAERTGRPLAPRASSPRCSRVSGPREPASVSIVYPHAGTSFRLDPALKRQEIVLEARAPATARVRYVLDGRPLATVDAPFRLVWALEPGVHRLEAESAGATASAGFSVE